MKRRPPRPQYGYVEEHVLKTMSEVGPLSAWLYAELFNLQRATANDRLRKVWDSKAAHIVYYERPLSGRQVPFYDIGYCEDEGKLPPLSDVERAMRYQESEKGLQTVRKEQRKRREKHKQRMKVDWEYAEQIRKRDREAFRKKTGAKPRVKKVVDPLLNALMGVKK